MTDCRACEKGRHYDCDSTVWADDGTPEHCECWADGHQPYQPYDDPFGDWFADPEYRADQAEARHNRSDR